MKLHDDRAGRLILGLRQQGVTDPRVLAAFRAYMRAADDDAAWMDSDDLASLLDSDEEGSVGSYAGSE